jgi:hypothetical protein
VAKGVWTGVMVWAVDDQRSLGLGDLTLNATFSKLPHASLRTRAKGKKVPPAIQNVAATRGTRTRKEHRANQRWMRLIVRQQRAAAGPFKLGGVRWRAVHRDGGGSSGKGHA